MAEQRVGAVTMKGEPVTLLGPEPQVGRPAPGFTAVDANWNEVKLGDFAGRTVLISAVVSVDTGVCSRQTQRFNREADNLPEGAVVLTISRDLPFALDRFCGAEGVDRIQVLSDHVPGDFGPNYGILIESMRLLARAIFVVDPAGRLSYKEIVPEITDHPDYGAALQAAREAVEANG